jgi:hypothetical protein
MKLGSSSGCSRIFGGDSERELLESRRLAVIAEVTQPPRQLGRVGVRALLPLCCAGEPAGGVVHHFRARHVNIGIVR